MKGLKLKSSTVIKRNGRSDLVILHTTLPSPVPGLDKAPLDLQFDVEVGKGQAYLVYHFVDEGLLNLEDIKVIVEPDFSIPFSDS